MDLTLFEFFSLSTDLSVPLFRIDMVHFRRIIAAHTNVNLGDCSYLDTCRHMKTCKYVHYELDSTPDVSALMMGAATLPPPKPLKPQHAHYCSEVELGEPQWINCDIRSFRMDILGQFGVIMADPPWHIHMELPYGTMPDDEMRTLNVPALQTDGLIFLWVTGRAMELGRECLELWGYKRVEEIIWVKTNQLQRIIRTGRTGHWLNHSKEHCLVGIKGNPEVNRNIDTDVIVADVRETSRKPDEMYSLIERLSPRTRKVELFARMNNVHAGWMSLGNQLEGVRLVDEGLRARFKAAYPDVEVQPASPPRPSAMKVDSSSSQMRNTFAGGELKAAETQVAEATAPDAAYASSFVVRYFYLPTQDFAGGCGVLRPLRFSGCGTSCNVPAVNLLKGALQYSEPISQWPMAPFRRLTAGTLQLVPPPENLNGRRTPHPPAKSCVGR
ncbi:putative N6-adenosine-methyltransferase MT-A70-like [Capsicum baccatum]|uniref:N6-adenosine-methyltransferase MT-A70-like n=1 Tax=Capsicum baccatum TaxID=33114 RepID=A0A2G2VXB9_CAPBA|nr:putative N6-adenosine-methyltransferase MT-A70-like [Capsicum baccatum]